MLLLGLAVFTVGLSYVMSLWVQEDASLRVEELSSRYQRIVSLTPAMTHTFAALDVSEKLVGISDYCDSEPSLNHTKRVGTGLTPNYEGIVKLRPDLIVLESTKQGDYKKLEAIAETRVLAWLTLEEVAASTRELGVITGQVEQADKLGAKLSSVLGNESPIDGPRVLLLLGLSSFDGGSLWFIKRNSLHGAGLHAAGARNAVERDIAGAPSMSMEELLKVDPDIIITMVSQAELTESDKAIYLKRMSELGVLKAVESKKIGFIVGKKHMGTGPEILDFVDALRLEVQRLSGGT